MPIRYTSEFRNILGILYKVEIIDEDFSGFSTDFTLYGQDGCTLKYQKQGDRSYNLIKASSLNLDFAVNNDDDLSFINDLSTSNEGRFKIKLYRDDEFTGQNEPTGANYLLNWAGIILSDMITYNDDAYPFSCKITATDGLGLLSSIKFTEPDGTAKNGRHSVIDWIIDALRLTGITDLWGNDDLFIQTFVKWFEVNTMTPEIDDPAALIHLYYDSFNTIGEDGQLKPKTALQMINIVCTLLQARLILVNGSFRLQQTESLSDTSLLFNYKKDGTAHGNPTIVNGIFDVPGESSNGNSTGFFQRQQSWIRPLSDVNLTWQAGGVNSTGNIYPLFYSNYVQTPANPTNLEGQVIDSAEFSQVYGNFFLPTSQGWSQLGYSTPPQLGGSFDVSLGSYKIEIGIQLDFHLTKKSDNVVGANDFFIARFFRQNLKVRFKDQDGIQSNDRFLRIDTNGHTNTDVSPIVLDADNLPNGNSWLGEEITSDSTARVKLSSDFMSIGASQPVGSVVSSTLNTTIYSPTIPLDSTLELLADSLADLKIVTADNVEVGLDDITIFGNFKIELGVPKFTVKVKKDGQLINNTSTAAYNVDTSNDLVQSGNYTQEMYFGDGPNGVGFKTIWIKNGATFVQSLLWNLNSIAVDKTIHKLAIESIVKLNRFHRPALDAACIESTATSFVDIANKPNEVYRRIYDSRNGNFEVKNYLFNGGSYNLGMAQLVGQWLTYTADDLTGMQVNDNQIPEETLPGDGAFYLTPPQTTVFEAETDSVTKLTDSDGITIAGGSITNLNISSLATDLDNNYELNLVDPVGDKVQKVILNGAAAKGATSLTVDAFTPSFNFAKGSFLRPSVKSAIIQANASSSSPAGADKEIQFNDGGIFGADKALIFDKTTGDLKVKNEIIGVVRQTIGVSFYDNLGTGIHYLPFYSTNETPSSISDDVNLLLNYESKIDYITFRTDNGIAGSGNITLRSYRIPLGSTSSILLDSVTVAVTTAANKKAIVFKFNELKMKKGDRVLISILCDSGVSTSYRYWYGTLSLMTNLADRYTATGIY